MAGLAPDGPTGPPSARRRTSSRFTAVLPQWRELLARTGLLSRTVLVAPPWAAVTETGEAALSSFGLDAGRANELTPGPTSTQPSSVLGIPVLGRELTAALSHTGHQWGAAPFHYDDATYLALAGEVASAARRLCDPGAGSPCRHPT